MHETPDIRLIVYRYPRPDPSRWADLVHAAAHPDWRAAELKAALIARSRMIDGAGPLTTRYGLLDPENDRNDP